MLRPLRPPSMPPPLSALRLPPCLLLLCLCLCLTIRSICAQAPSLPSPSPSPVSSSLSPRDDAGVTLPPGPFTCCAMMQYPNLYESSFKPHGLEGMAINYLEDLQTVTGFQCTTIDIVPDDIRFTGFIMEMEKCDASNGTAGDPRVCRCDVGVGGWMLTQQRLARVQYLPPFVRDDMRVITHIDTTFTSTPQPFFIRTFTPSVWIAIVGLMVLWTFLKVLDKRFVPPDSDFRPLSRDVTWYRRKKHIVLKSNLARRLRKSFQSTVGRMIGQQDESVESVNSSTRQWTLNFIILLCGLFFTLIYEATMTANLVQESRQSDFRSVDDFRRCIIEPYDVCVVRGGAVNAFWSTITRDEKCHESKKAQLVSSYEGAVDRVANKTCKYLLVDGSTARYGTDVKYCRKIVMTGDPVYPATNSFVVPKSSALYEPLANGTLKLLEQGRLESLESYFNRRGKCVLPEATIITFDKLHVFFIAAYVATGLVFLEMILDPQQIEPVGREQQGEQAQRKKKKKKHGRDDDAEREQEDDMDLEMDIDVDRSERDIHTDTSVR